MSIENPLNIQKLKDPDTFKKVMETLEIPTEPIEGVDFELSVLWDGKEFSPEVEEKWGGNNTETFYSLKNSAESKVFQQLSDKIKKITEKSDFLGKVKIKGKAGNGISLSDLDFGEQGEQEEREIREKLSDFGYINKDIEAEKVKEKTAKKIAKKLEDDYNKKLKEEMEKEKDKYDTELKKIKDELRKIVYE